MWRLSSYGKSRGAADKAQCRKIEANTNESVCEGCQEQPFELSRCTRVE
jgi:hypothetical protein